MYGASNTAPRLSLIVTALAASAAPIDSPTTPVHALRLPHRFELARHGDVIVGRRCSSKDTRRRP